MNPKIISAVLVITAQFTLAVFIFFALPNFTLWLRVPAAIVIEVVIINIYIRNYLKLINIKTKK
jgi:hypothetical protein